MMRKRWGIAASILALACTVCCGVWLQSRSRAQHVADELMRPSFAVGWYRYDTHFETGWSAEFHCCGMWYMSYNNSNAHVAIDFPPWVLVSFGGKVLTAETWNLKRLEREPSTQSDAASRAPAP
jgi:hypothetical protein